MDWISVTGRTECDDDMVLAHIGKIAATCYGKVPKDPTKIALACYERGHTSVFEHASITFDIRGISRACSHQLVRHRLASYTQVSQRYTKVGGKDWYVTPPTLGDLDRQYFTSAMEDAHRNYDSLLKGGVKPEDARYVLPNATKTDITVTMNLRELMSFLELRLDSHAQWEIRKLAEAMRVMALVTYPDLSNIHIFAGGSDAQD